MRIFLLSRSGFYYQFIVTYFFPRRVIFGERCLEIKAAILRAIKTVAGQTRKTSRAGKYMTRNRQGR